MRMWQQVMVVAAVVFATVAVGVNVFASTRGAEQRAQRLAVDIPVASVLDRGVFDDPPIDDSAGDTEEVNDQCVASDGCHDPQPNANDGNARMHPQNHGLIVLGYAKHIGYDHVAGPPGFVVRDIARPTDRDDDKAPPGLSRDDDKAPPGLDKADDKRSPGKNKDG